MTNTESDTNSDMILSLDKLSNNKNIFLLTDLQYEHQILECIKQANSQEMYSLLEEISNVSLIKRIVAIRFQNEAVLKNEDLNNPFIIWKAMNRKPQPWVALALAKVAKEELGIKDGDVIITIPSSGSWLGVELRTMFPNSVFPILKKELEQGDNLYAQFDVLSHSQERSAKKMFLCSNPNIFWGKRMFIFDDVVARGDAMKGVAAALGKDNIAGTAAVMDKTMQRENPNLGIGGGYSALFAIDKVEKSEAGEVDFILS